jgi:hypothetical protein
MDFEIGALIGTYWFRATRDPQDIGMSNETTTIQQSPGIARILHNLCINTRFYV